MLPYSTLYCKYIGDYLAIFIVCKINKLPNCTLFLTRPSYKTYIKPYYVGYLESGLYSQF